MVYEIHFKMITAGILIVPLRLKAMPGYIVDISFIIFFEIL